MSNFLTSSPDTVGGDGGRPLITCNTFLFPRGCQPLD